MESSDPSSRDQHVVYPEPLLPSLPSQPAVAENDRNEYLAVAHQQDGSGSSDAPPAHIGGGSGFNAGNNDPSARFDNIRNAYLSLDRLTSAVATSFEPQQPQRRMIDVVRDFSETSKLHNESTSEVERTFYQSALTVLTAEMNAFSNQNNNNSTN